jgi:hypothetical protein
MGASQNSVQDLAAVNAIIERTCGNGDQFAETLRRERIPHLSYSQITAVEFCEYRYLLQYVTQVDPNPIPEYYRKGKWLHWALATFYDNIKRNLPLSYEPLLRSFEREFEGENLRHMQNALETTPPTHGKIARCSQWNPLSR